MSCKASSRLKVSKRSDKVSVLWNGRQSFAKEKSGGVPRYTIELSSKAKNGNESRVSVRKSSSREANTNTNANANVNDIKSECQGQQFMRIVVSSKNLSGGDLNNLQIDIVNSHGGANQLRDPPHHQHQQSVPETPAPFSRYKIARNAAMTTGNMISPKQSLNESNFASVQAPRKKIFQLGNTSKLSINDKESSRQRKPEPQLESQHEFNPTNSSISQSRNRSFVSMHSSKPLQPLGLSKVSAVQQSNIGSSKGPAAELSFPMLEKKLLDTSAHHSSVHVSSIHHQQKSQQRSVDKENTRHSTSRKKIFVHPIKIKCNNGNVTSMKPPSLEASYRLQAKVLESVHSDMPDYTSNVHRRHPYLTDINEQPIMPGCCL